MKKTVQTLLSVTLLMCCFVFTAEAQTIARAEVEEDVRTATATENPIAFLAAQRTVSDTWVAQIDRQYAEWLKKSDDPSREQALQEVILIANQHGDKVTFEKVVSPLIGVYIFDKSEKHRLMALSALHAIGDRYGMERLRELANNDPSEKVRRLTHRALVDYYSSKN